MMLMKPNLRGLLTNMKADFFSPDTSRVVFDFLKKNPKFNGEPKLAASLQDISDYVKVISLQFEELYKDLPQDDLEAQALGLKHRLLQRYVKTQKHRLAQEMVQTADERKLKKLIADADKLNELIK